MVGRRQIQSHNHESHPSILARPGLRLGGQTGKGRALNQEQQGEKKSAVIVLSAALVLTSLVSGDAGTNVLLVVTICIESSI